VYRTIIAVQADSAAASASMCQHLKSTYRSHDNLYVQYSRPCCRLCHFTKASCMHHLFEVLIFAAASSSWHHTSSLDYGTIAQDRLLQNSPQNGYLLHTEPTRGSYICYCKTSQSFVPSAETFFSIPQAQPLVFDPQP